VSENHVPERRTATAWAPWWVYLVVILGANYLRQAVMPLGTVPEWAVVLLVIGISAVLFIAITAIYRATTRRSTPAR
jgi:apolipoprotein N-acyltransferase